jgi:ATP-dependent protease HslVU (ClpYQ) peptidase subunit
MTTIAYCLKRGNIATDSRITEGGEIITDDATKRHNRGALVLFMAGAIADIDEVANGFVACKHRCRKSLDAEGLIWTGDTLFEIIAASGQLEWHRVVSERGAIGSGAQYARAALDAGLSPAASVRAAAKRNCYTGGKIKVYKLEKS